MELSLSVAIMIADGKVDILFVNSVSVGNHLKSSLPSAMIIVQVLTSFSQPKLLPAKEGGHIAARYCFSPYADNNAYSG